MYPSLGCSLSFLTAAVTAAAGCAVGGGPAELRLAPIDPQVAFVGTELSIPLDAQDPEGDRLAWRFQSDVPEMCRAGRCRAGIQTLDEGGAVFKWSPLPEDVGRWTVGIQVTDGRTVSSQAVQIEVRSSVGYEGLPRFVQPLGTGTTIDLARQACVEFDVVVDDPDSAEVTIAQEQPIIAGATLSSNDEFTATWRWCPTEAQLREGGHRRLTLSAADGSNPKTMKSYLVVVRRPPKPGCGGVAPSIAHTPTSWTSSGDVRITARVRDDVGIKHEPLLYYSTTRPSDTPDLGRMTQVTMIRTNGSNADGTFEAIVPNPANSLPAGGSATLYYVIAAEDDGDGSGGCERVTQAPERGSFDITVSTATAGDPSLAGRACDRCSSDRACGGADDGCVRMGTSGTSYCLLACASDGDCGTGYRCGSDTVSTVDGARRRFCVPDTGTCGASETSSCSDDAREENDTRSAAMSRPPLPPGMHGSLVSCHGSDRDDEDWYMIRVADAAQVLAEIAGSDETDIDLALHEGDGTLVESSDSLRSTEEITACLAPGDYFLRVHSYGEGRNEYGLAWSTRAASCTASSVCAPDPREPDDSASTARRVSLTSPYSSTGNTICGGSDDWYSVTLRTGQTLVVELDFIQTSADEDLDLHFIDSSGTDLAPCTEADPSTCSAFQGQSVDSNEYYEHTVETGGTYYVVVHGFAGSQNSYDIRMRLE
jgi:hypothetical protein